MLPDDRDSARLWDMLNHAREIVETLSGIPFERYLADRNLRLATERRIEIIGEAARPTRPAPASRPRWTMIVVPALDRYSASECRGQKLRLSPTRR